MNTLYRVSRIKGKGFVSADLVYSMNRFIADKNISMVINLDTNEVIVQRIKDREKLNSQQGSWNVLKTC